MPETDTPLEQVQNELAELKHSYAFLEREVERLHSEVQSKGLLQQNLLRVTGNYIWEWDVQSDRVFISPELKQLLGYEKNELQDYLQGWDRIIHQEDKEKVSTELQRLVSGEASIYSSEHRILCRDGSIKWVSGRGFIVKADPDITPLHITGTYTDITFNKRKLSNLKEENSFLNNLFRLNTLCMLTVDAETGDILEANYAAQMFYGYPLNQLTAKNIADLNVFNDTGMRRQTGYSEFKGFAGNGGAGVVFPQRLASGEVRMAEVFSTPVIKNNRQLFFLIINDVTNRLTDETRLKNNEENLRNFISNSSDGFFLTDEEGLVTHWNFSMQRITGFSEKEVLGRPVIDVQTELTLYPAQSTQSKETLQNVLLDFFKYGTGSFLNKTLDLAITNKFGEVKYIQQICFGFRTEWGYSLGAVTRDVTGLKEKEQELISSEEMFRTIFQNAPLGVAQIDSNSNFATANESLCHLLSYESEKLLHLSLLRVTYREDMWKVNQNLQRLFAGKSQFTNIECRLQTSTEAIIWVMLSLSIINTRGKNPFYIVFVTDLTEQKQIELLLREKDEKLQRIFDLLPAGIIITGKEGKITEANSASQQLFGLKKDPKNDSVYVHDTLDVINTDGTPALHEQTISARAKKENRFLKDIRLGLKKQDETIWLNVCAAPLPLSDAEVFISYTDITKELNREKKLIELNSELRVNRKLLEEANKAKDKFISVLAHDLRAPFMVFVGLSQMLAHEDITTFTLQEISDMAGKMYKSAINTLHLLNDMLDWGRLYTNTMNFNLELIPVEAVVSAALEILDSALTEKQIAVTTNIENGITIQADKSMLSNVIRNLLSNAIKFSYRGGTIVITCFTADTNICIEVEDFGTGMTKDVAEKLFILGENSSSYGTEQEKGSGLGLLVCNEFVNKMNGKISVETQQGKGTKFTITLPGTKL